MWNTIPEKYNLEKMVLVTEVSSSSLPKYGGISVGWTKLYSFNEKQGSSYVLIIDKMFLR